MLSVLIYGWLSVLLAFPPQTKTITSEEAKAHAGENVIVCGIVSGVYVPRRSKRNPTILNFDQPYPKNQFAAVVWKKDRAKFEDLKSLESQRICVSGEVYEYRQRFQIKLSQSNQLKTN